MTKPNFLSADQVRKHYPSVYAESHDGKRSDRYTFVPTSRIIDELDALDFGIARVRAPKVRKADPEFCKHEIVFRPRDESLYFEDPRIAVINHGTHHLNAAKIYPELKIVNSSDGSCSFNAMIGLFALICANGLTVAAAMIGNISLRHQGFDAEDAFNLVNEFSKKLPTVMGTVQEWGQIKLSDEARFDFASRAAALRWDKPTFDPKVLLQPRRNADMEKNLWTTYNVIQENLIQGGFRPNQPKARKVRTLTNIVASNSVNDQLWDLASEYRNVA